MLQRKAKREEEAKSGKLEPQNKLRMFLDMIADGLTKFPGASRQQVLSVNLPTSAESS